MLKGKKSGLFEQIINVTKTAINWWLIMVKINRKCKVCNKLLIETEFEHYQDKTDWVCFWCPNHYDSILINIKTGEIIETKDEIEQ